MKTFIYKVDFLLQKFILFINFNFSVTVSARTSPVEENGTSSATNSPSKRKKLEEKPFFEILDDDGKSDRYCWRCHKEAIEARCSMCPRSWHRRCMGGAPPLSITEWVCSECTGILQAENKETRSPVLAHLTPDLLCMMLRYIVERMREQTGVSIKKISLIKDENSQ